MCLANYSAKRHVFLPELNNKEWISIRATVLGYPHVFKLEVKRLCRSHKAIIALNWVL